MTYDEFLAEATDERGHIEVEIVDEDGHDPLVDGAAGGVIDISYNGGHAVIVPYTVPGDFTLEIAIFDETGVRRTYEIVSMVKREPSAP